MHLYEESPTGSQWEGWGGAVPRWLAEVLPPPRDRREIPSQEQTGIQFYVSAAIAGFVRVAADIWYLCLPVLPPSSTRYTNVLWM